MVSARISDSGVTTRRWEWGPARILLAMLDRNVRVVNEPLEGQCDQTQGVQPDRTAERSGSAPSGMISTETARPFEAIASAASNAEVSASSRVAKAIWVRSP